MSDTLGPFRLMEKIEEDVLGEIYCAARTSEGGRQEIALLRLFDPEGLDADRFEDRIAAREPLAARQPTEELAVSRGLGVVEGRAFDFFSYLPGLSLASLIELAKRHREPFPLPVALFIAGRVADGLADAYRQEIGGENALHGFVMPCLVMVSEEGSVQLGGLEVAPALRDFRGTAATLARILPYLSPESVAGEDLHPSDDVYSLGALLYELLTLERLAAASDLRVETPEIPSELRYFLDRSVAPRFRRIQSVVEWLRDLKTLAAGEGWVASARDLSAFYAEVDERVNPVKPDTSEITASDQEIFAQMIREARAANPEAASASPRSEITGPGEGPAPEPECDSPAAKGTSYETSEIPRDALPVPEDGGRLVKTSHVKRAMYSPTTPPV